MLKKLVVSFLLSYSFAFGQWTNKTFPKVASSLNIPMRIPLVELNKIINNNTKDLLYEDNSYLDNDNDQFKIKVWKTRNIRLVAGTTQNFLVEVPLKIWAEKGIGTLGVYHYQSTSFETVMYFNTDIILTKNWGIATKTKANGYKWVQKPVLDFGSVKIPITPLVEKSLKKEQEKICSTIDMQMGKELNFQKNILEAWNSFQQPMLINKEYNTWLKVSPQKINLSPLKFYKDEIQTTIGINLISETFVGEKPSENPAIKTLSPLELADIPNKKFQLMTTAQIPITEANAIAEKQFLNKEFDFRNDKIKITAISVKNENDKITIDADTEGAINGKILIRGLPKYDAEKRKIVLTDTKFKLKTHNILHKTASLLFKSKIINTIEQEYGIPTDEMENNAKKSIEESFNKSYPNGLLMSGTVYSIQPNEIDLTESNIMVLVKTEAELKLTLNNTKD